MKQTIIKYNIFLIALVIFTACSTKKNTALTRGFHNLTSRYNILFNGWESFEKGLDKLEDSYKDDYSELLPIFIYQDKNQVSAIGSEMDRAIQKGTKIISLHSITAKPEIKENRDLTLKEREFYNKKEYNKWIDNAYLLVGKGHFYKHEFSQAGETFQFIISNYPDGEPQLEARIWLARLALNKDRFKEAEGIIAELEESTDLPKHLVPEFEATKALMEIKKSNYSIAAEHLTISLKTTQSKYYKQRYSYILAQLYQESNKLDLAAEYYKKVVKLNPPYEMTFNARINMALSYTAGTTSRKEIEKQLQKMLRDDKNIDFQDQIYYAWGNLYFQEGNTSEALKYYLKSASVSKGNIPQQARTYLTIADIYYEQPNYVPSQVFYDSAVGIIDANYPNYTIIYAKSISLTNLVDNINTVQLQDSVQKLAYMPKPELYAYIDKIIAAERKRETEQKQLERERLLNETFATQQQYELQTSSTSWYFYNSVAVNAGRQEFKKTWGSRILEDNWRRKNKSVNDFGSSIANVSDIGAAEDQTNEKTAKKASGKYSRAFYITNIPFTDSAMEASHQQIQEALYSMGNIYGDELNDYDKAIKSFEELLKRYPTYENRLSVYYKLYSIGKQTKNIGMVSGYQQKIINEFPNSKYALVLSDPNYFKEIQRLENRQDDLYKEIYITFQNSQYAYTTNLIDQVYKEFPENKYKSQLDYMLTVSEGISKDTVVFISDLQKLISRHPNSEIADRSQLLINYLKKKNPEAARKQSIQEAATLYSDNSNEVHLVVISMPNGQNVNQLMFNITGFNIDNYADDDLKVNKTDINGNSLLNITSFENKEQATIYYSKLKNHPDLFHDVNPAGSHLFYISKSNSALLNRDKKLDQYLTFFEEKVR